MVVPLGLLALGGTALLKPLYDDWVQGRQGRRVGGILDQAGSDPMAQAGALARAGLITPAQMLDFGQGQQGFGLDMRRLDQQQAQFDRGQALDWARFGLDQETASQSRLERAQDRAMRMAGGNGYQPIGQIDGEMMNAAKLAIAANESQGFGNPYAAIGPDTGDGNRAIGKYQIMASNVPAWTQEALGVAMSPEEFAQNPEAQELVFEHRFGGYLDRYGTFEDAASAWFSGRPAAQALAETPQGDGYLGTAQYIGQASQAFQRQMAIGAQSRERATALRGLEIDADAATAPLLEAQDAATAVLSGLDSVGRFGSGYLNSAEGKAEVDQLRSNAEVLFHTWRREVYGDAEPSPATLEQLREAFPQPGASNWENRERSARYFRMMQAELGRKADYERAKVLYKAGAISREDYQRTNGGRLTEAERKAILGGERTNRPARFSREVQ